MSVTALPRNWRRVRLKFLADLKSGEGITSQRIEADGPFPVYGGNGIRGYTDDFTHSGHHVLVGRQGALCGNVHRVSGRFWASEHAVVATMRDASDARWYAYLLESMNLRQYSVSAAQPGLAVDRIRELAAPVPPAASQRAIADFLDRKTAAIDTLIADKERLVALLAEKRAALIHRAVTKGLDPDVPMKDSGIPWIGEVPAYWEVARIKHVCRLESGHTPSRSEPSYWIPDECTIPWVSLNDSKVLAQSDYIDDTKYRISPTGMANSSAHLIESGAVVFTRDATIGLAGITTRPMAVSQHIIAWVCGSTIRNKFLLRAINVMTQELERLTFGATIKTIGMGDVKELVTPVPPLSEQDAITVFLNAKLRAIDDTDSLVRLEVDKLREYRQALITAAVTGQIDVTGQAEEEAA